MRPMALTELGSTLRGKDRLELFTPNIQVGQPGKLKGQIEVSQAAVCPDLSCGLPILE